MVRLQSGRSMPTNILRESNDAKKSQPRPALARGEVRRALLKVGRVSIRIEFASTATADLVWNALPLHSSAETWGAAIHFEVPLESGRDRTARIIGTPGDIYFWVEDDRILVPFGATPISKPGECRLPAPCNVWAKALDDVTALAKITPGEKVSLVAA
jgi:uncharacterized protein